MVGEASCSEMGGRHRQYLCSKTKATPVAAAADAVSAREAVRPGARAHCCAPDASAPLQTRLTTLPQFLHRGTTGIWNTNTRKLEQQKCRQRIVLFCINF